MKLLLALAALVMLTSEVNSVIQLESYNIDPNSVTVSGISAGAAMATQMHVVHSDIVHGAAMFAGVPYYCAIGVLAEALVCMGTPNLVNVELLIYYTNIYASQGKIANTDNLLGDKVYIFAGALDTVVKPESGDKISLFYDDYGSNILKVNSIQAEHCQPTANQGAACSYLGSPYINDCDYDGAFEALNFLYASTLTPVTGSETLLGEFYEFDQAPMLDSGTPDDYSMDNIGYIYIPSQCADKLTTCKLHIAFHGCLQGRELLGDMFARDTGYLEVAEVNNIITLFPQVVTTPLSNPNGCFDWWGYTGSLKYATQEGPQIMAIRRMIETLLG